MTVQPDHQQTERRINRQIEKIRELEGTGRFSEAERARELLAVITETATPCDDDNRLLATSWRPSSGGPC